MNPGPEWRRPPSLAPTLQAKFISVMAGLLGVATGIAVFVLMVHKPDEITLWFGLFLFVAATLSFAFEYLRSEIEGHEEKLSFSRVLTVLVVLAIFELFVTAIHASFSLDWAGLQDIASAVAGPALGARVKPEINLILLACLWVVIGGVLALALAYAIYWPFQPRGRLRGLVTEKRRGWAMGLAAGAVGAPLLILVYILSVRLALEIVFMLTRPVEWSNYLDKLLKYSPIPWLVYIMSWTSSRWGSWGVIAALGIAAAVVAAIRGFGKHKPANNELLKMVVFGLVVVFALPLAGVSVMDDLRNIAKILAFVAISWSVAGFLLGVMVPMLNRWSANPRHWAYLSWAASVVMLLFAVAVRAEWFWACTILAIVFLLAGVVLRLGGSPAEYWTIAAISIAVVILGSTHLMLKANFFNVSNLCLSLIGEESPALEKWGQQTASLRFSDNSEGTKAHIQMHDRELAGEIDRYISNEQKAALARGSVRPKDYLSWRVPLSWLLSRGDEALKRQEEVFRSLEERSVCLAELTREPDAIERMARVVRLESSATAKRPVCRLIETSRRDKPQAESTTAELLSQSQRSLDELHQLREAVKKESERPIAPASAALSYEDVSRLAWTLSKKEDPLVTLSARLAAQSEILDKEKGRLEGVVKILRDKIADERKTMAQKFELCIAGSAGFWLAMGILATWSIRNRESGAPDERHGG